MLTSLPAEAGSYDRRGPTKAERPEIFRLKAEAMTDGVQREQNVGDLPPEGGSYGGSHDITATS